LDRLKVAAIRFPPTSLPDHNGPRKSEVLSYYYFPLEIDSKGCNISNAMERKSLPIDFRQLETFCRVAELKSFSKAANDLYLTQPTVSGHVLALEKSLQLRLFDRMGRETRLTKAGKVFLEYALRILSYRKEALSAISEFSQGIRGELLLGASTIPGEYVLPQLIAGFRRDYPQVLFSLKMGDTREVVQFVLQGEVELGLVGAKLKRDQLHYDFFVEDELVVIGSPEFASLRGAKIDVEEAFREPWILREEGSGTQIAVEKVFNKKGKSLRQLNRVAEMGSTSAVKQGVKAGLGLAFVSRKAVYEELTAGSLDRIEITGLDPISRPIYTVFHSGRTLSPVGSRFLRFLKKTKEGSL
jgi:DNA-binding transcriptional LysR family regulator